MLNLSNLRLCEFPGCDESYARFVSFGLERMKKEGWALMLIRVYDADGKHIFSRGGWLCSSHVDKVSKMAKLAQRPVLVCDIPGNKPS